MEEETIDIVVDDHNNSSNIMDDEFVHQFGGKIFQSFADSYDIVHKPLSSLICVIGIVSNAVNLLVLTRPQMINVTNILLTGLSSAQLFLLTNYMSLLLYNYLIEKCLFPGMAQSYGWAVYKWVNVNLSVAFHSTALFHTLFLALFRFIAIQIPHFSRSHLNFNTARGCVLVLHILIPFLCCPTFFTTSIKIIREKICGLDEYYDLRYVASPEFFQATLWIYGVVFKLVPSVVILVISFYLIKSLKNIDQKTSLLTGKTNMKRKSFRLKLTKMFIIVAFLCVGVEFPHGVVNLLTGIFGAQFGREVYDNLGDFFEMLTLFYSSVNFVLYCLMNVGYMQTCKSLIHGICPRSFCGKLLEESNAESIANNKSNEITAPGYTRKFSDYPADAV